MKQPLVRRERPETTDQAIARLLMEIAIRVAYIEQLNPAAECDETLRCARQLVKALRPFKALDR